MGRQVANFADFCNDCGNCDVFCPEEGRPYAAKPRFFGSETAWRAETGRDGLYAERHRILGRFDGREYSLEHADGRVLFSGPGYSLAFDPAHPEETVTGDGPAQIDLTWYHLLDALHRGVFSGESVNYVNQRCEPQASTDVVARAPAGGRARNNSLADPLETARA